jgi:hypothetical protein
MSKFKVRMKLQGFELEIEGSREDVPLIAQNLSQQLSGLMAPTGAIIEGETVESARIGAAPPPSVDPSSGFSQTKRKPRRRHNATKPATDTADTVINWRHDSSKYGAPKQAWSTANKALWILYVVKSETEETELSGTQIADTFNKQFRQAGTIKNFNVNRDLGKLKVRKGAALVGEDTTKDPSRWFLTEAGDKKAQELIGEALGAV